MMENKFTPRAEESLRLAQEAAEEMGHGYVGSEHLLLGLMREEEGIAHRVLEEAGLTDDMICDVLHRSVGTGLSLSLIHISPLLPRSPWRICSARSRPVR